MGSISAEVMGTSPGRSLVILGTCNACLATGRRCGGASNLGVDAWDLRRLRVVEPRRCDPLMARDCARQFICVAGSPPEKQQIGFSRQVSAPVVHKVEQKSACITWR